MIKTTSLRSFKHNLSDDEKECIMSKHNTHFDEAAALEFYNMERPTCKVCGDYVKWHKSVSKYKETCSYTCMQRTIDYSERVEKTKKTNLERYGVENYTQTEEYKSLPKPEKSEKFYESIRKRDNKALMEKVKKTNMSRYGVQNVSSSSVVRDKIKLTNLDKYGTEHYTQSDIYKEDQRTKLLEKYKQEYQVSGIIQDMIRPTVEHMITRVEYVCHKHGVDHIPTETFKWRYKNYGDVCKDCLGLVAGRSLLEKEVFDYVSTLVECENNIKINNIEYDIHIPTKDVYIEFNGIYWHSVECGKDKNYHVRKSNNVNGQVIHIFEDEWVFKKDIVKSILKNKLGFVDCRIFARKTKVVKIDHHTTKEFMDSYHIYGYKRCTKNYGLYYDGELVSVMTFSKTNHSRKQNIWEIDRFATKFDTQVIGGAGKLFKEFIDDINPEIVMSYVDLRYGDGQVYSNIGFELQSVTEPRYFYTKGNQRIHRYALRKTEEENKTGKTEFELRSEQGYYRIYDCGHNKWIWTK